MKTIKLDNFNLLILILVFVPIAFLDTSKSLIHLWITDNTYTHGFLIPLISLWLIYRERYIINSTKATISLSLTPLFVVAIIIWILSNILGINVTEQLSFVAITCLIPTIALGTKILKHIQFPLFFLFLSVPMGKSLIPPLMDTTADIAVYLVDSVGIPVYREGLYFVLPTGNWSVVEACSGLNYLVASITLGILYSYINYNSIQKRLFFIVALAMISILANGLRAFGIVIIGHFSNMRYGTGGDHTFYGWIFYGIIIFCIFFIGTWWADRNFSENRFNPKKQSSNSHRVPMIVSLGLILISAFATYLPITSYFVTGHYQGREHLNLPDSIGDWTKSDKLGIDPPNISWKPTIVGTDYIIDEIYTKNETKLRITLGYYPWQSQGKEAVSSENKIVTPLEKNWRIKERRVFTYNEISFSETVISRSQLNYLIWQWYYIGNSETNSPRIAKLLGLKNLIKSQRNDGSIIFLSIKVDNDDLESPRLNLKDFSDDLRPILAGVFSTPPRLQN